MMLGSDLESWSVLGALWWPSRAGLDQNKLLTGDGGHGLCRTAHFAQWGAVIHGSQVNSGPGRGTKFKLLPFLPVCPPV